MKLKFVKGCQKDINRFNAITSELDTDLIRSTIITERFLFLHLQLVNVYLLRLH